ncbi:MAG: hypothetical protein JJU28_20585 [Cyclobacteriaceae bacterium]|nr:hypothetical protein [Cyclobacteriaceae bacterium]
MYSNENPVRDGTFVEKSDKQYVEPCRGDTFYLTTNALIYKKNSFAPTALISSNDYFSTKMPRLQRLDGAK